MTPPAPDRVPSEPPPRRRWPAVVVLVVLVALGVYAVVLEPRWLEVTEHGAGSLTLLHLSDLHVAADGARERAVLEVVDRVRPDVVVITGDTVTDGAFHPAPLGEVLGALVARRPRLGVFAVPGNHEDWVGPEAVEAIRAAGVEVLVDRTVALEGGRLVLHGLALGRGAGAVGAPTPAFDVVLCHYPAVLPRVARPGLELVLAGHTHGGQVRLPLVGALVLPFESGPYDAGWFEHGGTRLFVSRGVGTSLLPLRFLCRPEVAVHRLDLAPSAGDAPAGSR